MRLEVKLSRNVLILVAVLWSVTSMAGCTRQGATSPGADASLPAIP